MKCTAFRLLLPLVAAVCTALPTFAAKAKEGKSAPTAPTELGKVMFVGDSITHGVNAPSWRWCFHKILADNGIKYESVGYRTGNYSNGVPAGVEYGGVEFNNVHSAQSSARAWELAGRKAGGRFDNTNLLNWLGLSDKTNKGAAYTGNTWTPDTFIMLIGTNDLLSDGPAGVNPDKVKNLLGEDLKGGDMKTILESMLKSNPKAKIYVMSVPCWTRHANNNDAAVHKGVEDYNWALQKALNHYKGKDVHYVEINDGLLDAQNATPFYGCENMFNRPGADGLHPSRQGDLIMANNLAKAMNIPGRTAGLARKALKGDEPKGKKAASSKSKVSMDAPAASGFSAEFRMPEQDANVTMADGSQGITLQFRDGKVLYGDATVLQGNSKARVMMKENKTKNPVCRIAYTPGNESQGVTGGFYVWCDDKLIGEALQPNAKETDFCGLKSSAPLAAPAVCAEGAYAPAVKNAPKGGFRLSTDKGNAAADYDTKDGVLTLRKAKKAELPKADAPAVVLENGAILKLADATGITRIRMGEAAALTLPAAALQQEIQMEVGKAFTLVIAGGKEGADVSRWHLTRDGKPVAAEATVPDRQAGTVLLTEKK